MVASGEAFKQPTLVTDDAMVKMEEIKDLAPLHNPAAIVGVNACRAAMPKTPMVLVFDTGFHFTMPEYAYMYAVKYEHYEKYKIRRYGAHGTSHKFVSQEAAKYVGKNIEDMKIVTCHLGNGSSITAVKGGKCIDTSMGFHSACRRADGNAQRRYRLRGGGIYRKKRGYERYRNAYVPE